MNRQLEDPSDVDRMIHGVFGLSLTLLALVGRPGVLRAVTAIAGTALMVRAASGRSVYPVESSRLDESLNDTFPASDPPASHSPDEPPSNAEAKWEAHRKATGGTGD